MVSCAKIPCTCLLGYGNCGKQFDTAEELQEHIELDHRLKALITMAAVECLVEKLDLPDLTHVMTRQQRDDLARAVVDGRLGRYLKRVD